MKELQTITLSAMITPSKEKEIEKALEVYNGNKSDLIREGVDMILAKIMKK